MRAIAQLGRRLRLCLGIAFLLSGAQAQTTARLAGTVRDVQGAVIVNAEITAQNVDTGEQRAVITDESGSYVLTFLQPGTYQITITAQNFASARFSNLRIGISETSNLNAVLRVARATTEVSVFLIIG
jgi:hypothetical protein